MAPEVLKDYGYATAAWGKWHNTPAEETTPTGPFENWPTGLGFEYFYGFLGDCLPPGLRRRQDRFAEDPAIPVHLVEIDFLDRAETDILADNLGRDQDKRARLRLAS